MPKIDNTIKIEQLKEVNAERRKDYHPTEDEQQVVTDLNALFIEDKNTRDEDVRRHFNERTLEQYLDDNQKRVDPYVEPRRRDDPQNWKTRYRNLLTRNKLLAILSKLALIRLEMRFKNRTGGGDEKRLKIFNAMHKFNSDMDDEDMKQFNIMWNAWVDGTVVICDHPEQKTQKVKSVKDFNPESGEIEVV